MYAVGLVFFVRLDPTAEVRLCALSNNDVVEAFAPVIDANSSVTVALFVPSSLFKLRHE